MGFIQLSSSRTGSNLRHVLVIGTGERAVAQAARTTGKITSGYHLVGFVDDDWEGTAAFRTRGGEHGGERVADFAGLPAYLRENVVDEIVLALPVSRLHDRGAEVMRLCGEQGITVRLPADLFSLSFARAKADVFLGDPAITLDAALDTTAEEGWVVAVRQALEATTALVMATLTSLFKRRRTV